MQFRVIVVTDPQTHKKQTRPQTGPITIHCAAAIASTQCNKLPFLTSVNNKKLSPTKTDSTSRKSTEAVEPKLHYFQIPFNWHIFPEITPGWARSLKGLPKKNLWGLLELTFLSPDQQCQKKKPQEQLFSTSSTFLKANAHIQLKATLAKNMYAH